MNNAGIVPANGVCHEDIHRQRTTITNWNDVGIDFSGDRVLGLRNGFRLSGLDVSWMVYESMH